MHRRQRSHQHRPQTDPARDCHRFLQRSALLPQLRVKSTIRMLFETTIPTIITSPISDMTFSVVPVTSRISRHSAQSRRNGEQE